MKRTSRHSLILVSTTFVYILLSCGNTPEPQTANSNGAAPSGLPEACAITALLDHDGFTPGFPTRLEAAVAWADGVSQDLDRVADEGLLPGDDTLQELQHEVTASMAVVAYLQEHGGSESTHNHVSISENDNGLVAEVTFEEIPAGGFVFSQRSLPVGGIVGEDC